MTQSQEHSGKSADGQVCKVAKKRETAWRQLNDNNAASGVSSTFSGKKSIERIYQNAISEPISRDHN